MIAAFNSMKLKTICLSLFWGLVISLTLSLVSTAFVMAQKALIKHSGAIIIIPDELPIYESGVVLFLSFMALYLALSNIELFKHGKRRKQILNFKKILGITIFLLMALSGFFFVYIGFYRYTEIYSDHIIISKGIIPHPKEYHFHDIVEVSLGYFHGLYFSEPTYDLRMIDGTKVNIAARGLYPKLFYAIDQILPKTVTRICNIGGKSHIIDKMPDTLRAYYMEKYQNLK